MRKFVVLLCGLLSCFWAGAAWANIDGNSLAGYYELETIDYSLYDDKHGKSSFSTDESNIWYSYFEADESAADKPLFVMLNGGPGAGTSLNLFSMNTAPYTLDRDHQADGSNGYTVNDNSWTELGNLLYIDAPATGFSYLEGGNSGSKLSRTYGFLGAGNFNPLIDAAQIVRVVLRFLNDHEDLKNNQVILVGESYGGTRVSTMLNQLLFHTHYGENGDQVYRDQALVDEIDAHFKDIYGQNTDVTPEVVARQFGRQVLIQPELAGVYQDDIQGEMFFGVAPYYDTVIKDLAAENGKKFPSRVPWYYRNLSKSSQVLMYYLPELFNHDGYNYSKYASWSSELEAYAAKTLLNYDSLCTVLNYQVDTIDKIKAINRFYAYNLILGVKAFGGLTMGEDQDRDSTWLVDPANSGYLAGDADARAELEFLARSNDYLDDLIYGDDLLSTGSRSLSSVLGITENYDRYLVPMNLAVWASFTQGISAESYYDINPDSSSIYGQMFLENLALVNTFLTDSEYDLVIYSPAIPEALKKYTSIVESVDYKRGKEIADGDQGYFKVNYKPASLAYTSTPESVELYYPYYATSGHSVSSAQPDKFKNDVNAWLASD